jgi:hypothetical protein
LKVQPEIAAGQRCWWRFTRPALVTPTPVPFLLPLNTSKRGICGFTEKVRLGASIAFLGLMAFSAVAIGLSLAGGMVHPSEVPYVLVLFLLAIPLCGLLVRTILLDLRRTRELVIDRRAHFVSLRRLNWQGQVWHEAATNLKECELRVHPVRLTVARSRVTGGPSEHWHGHALVIHVGGESFFIGVQKDPASLRAYLASLPPEIRQASKGEGPLLEGDAQVRVSSLWKGNSPIPAPIPVPPAFGPAPECRNCGYDLRGHPSAATPCPECGVRPMA